MISESVVRAQLPLALDSVDLPFLGARTQGKVRDLYCVNKSLVMVASDRISAFDRVLGLIPCKGQVLTQLAAFWFQQCADILPAAFIELADPNVTIAQLCQPLPVEVVVRGYMTGVTSTSLWHRYSLGERTIYGIDFPDGLAKNDPLPYPIITPTTKAQDGGHDERITEAEILAQGFTTPAQWAQIREAAIALFLRGQQIAQRGGLVLVDTKYEFGVALSGKVMLIDEMHTPDSSRFWNADTCAERTARGEEPENLDKEFLRLHYAAQGYTGEGEPPAISDDLAVQTASRYITACERLTGTEFTPASQPAAPRIEATLRAWQQEVSLKTV